MTISDWLTYDYICKGVCDSSCIYLEACSYPYHLNHMWVSKLLELTTEEEVKDYMEWIEAQPLGRIGCVLSCNGQGRKRGSKDESDRIQ